MQTRVDRAIDLYIQLGPGHSGRNAHHALVLGRTVIKQSFAKASVATGLYSTGTLESW